MNPSSAIALVCSTLGTGTASLLFPQPATIDAVSTEVSVKPRKPEILFIYESLPLRNLVLVYRIPRTLTTVQIDRLEVPSWEVNA
jgi:hypothetical protein